MNGAVVLLLFLCVCLLLVWGVLNAIENLSDEGPYDEPTFREQGPIFHDHHAEQPNPRSQFAWQSRSHFRAPD
jgi:hypothetical protein